MLTSSARQSNGSRICHPRHNKDLWLDSSQRRLRRTYHICEEPAESVLPRKTRTSVAVDEERMENSVITCINVKNSYEPHGSIEAITKMSNSHFCVRKEKFSLCLCFCVFSEAWFCSFGL